MTMSHKLSTSLVLATALVGGALLTGCAKKPAMPDAVVETTSAHLKRPNVHVSDAIAKACRIQFGDSDRAPKFDFDDAALLPEDREILSQLARCVTTGPLKGQKLALVGRADPRGESEYNMVLGDYRAGSVFEYLALLGVEPGGMRQTSRGELDAEGTDEDGFRRDRRVDVTLDKPAETGSAITSAGSSDAPSAP